MSTYYKHSGKVGISSILFFSLCSLVILPILALIYTYLVWYIPFIYINFIITAGFGVAVGIAINYFVVNLGKVRNPFVSAVFGIVGGLIALYFSWSIWVDLVLNVGESYGNSRIGITTSNIHLSQVLSLILSPELVASLAGEINQYGTWGIRSAPVSGLFLSIIWLIEALIVVVIATFLTIFRAKKPFCEFDNKWFEETVLPAFNFIEKPQELVKNLENFNKESFANLYLMKNVEESHHSLFTLYSSKKGKNFLSIENNKSITTSKGEKEFENTDVVEYISIDNDLKNKLMNVKEKEESIE